MVLLRTFLALAIAASGISLNPLDKLLFVDSRTFAIEALNYSAVPNDLSDDASAIQKALDRASKTGSQTVKLPTGTYVIEAQIDMPSNVSLVGAGCGQTILLRSQKLTGQMMFRLDGVRDVQFHDLSFEFNSAPEFFRAIGLRGAGSSGLVIANNCFHEHKPSDTGGDRWAIELSAQGISRNIRILKNRVEGRLQLTAGGGRGLSNVLVSDNEVLGAKANGVALSTLSDNVLFENIVIERNIVRNAQSIGIFVGPDKPSAQGGTFRSIRISENRIDGLRNRFTYGVFIRAPKDGISGLEIIANKLNGRFSAKATAIRLVDDHGHATREIKNVVICSNEGRNFSRGIWLQAVNGAVLRGNDFSNPRALTAEPQYNRAIRQLGPKVGDKLDKC